MKYYKLNDNEYAMVATYEGDALKYADDVKELKRTFDNLTLDDIRYIKENAKPCEISLEKVSHMITITQDNNEYHCVKTTIRHH